MRPVVLEGGRLREGQVITGPVPTLVAAGQTYVVPANSQVLWTLPIELEAGASIEALGDLVEVN